MKTRILLLVLAVLLPVAGYIQAGFVHVPVWKDLALYKGVGAGDLEFIGDVTSTGWHWADPALVRRWLEYPYAEASWEELLAEWHTWHELAQTVKGQQPILRDVSDVLAYVERLRGYIDSVPDLPRKVTIQKVEIREWGREGRRTLGIFQPFNVDGMPADTLVLSSELMLGGYYSDEPILGVLIHEMIHAAGVRDETATQVITLEVLAHMMDAGEPGAAWALYDELEGMARSAARWRSQWGDDLPEVWDELTWWSWEIDQSERAKPTIFDDTLAPEPKTLAGKLTWRAELFVQRWLLGWRPSFGIESWGPILPFWARSLLWNPERGTWAVGRQIGQGQRADQYRAILFDLYNARERERIYSGRKAVADSQGEVQFNSLRYYAGVWGVVQFHVGAAYPWLWYEARLWETWIGQQLVWLPYEVELPDLTAVYMRHVKGRWQGGEQFAFKTAIRTRWDMPLTLEGPAWGYYGLWLAFLAGMVLPGVGRRVCWKALEATIRLVTAWRRR